MRIKGLSARPLEFFALFTLLQIAEKEFGVDAKLLIDHAWGLEPSGMKKIKAYKPNTNSISEEQVLSCHYPYDKARIIVMEMADSLVLQLTDAVDAINKELRIYTEFINDTGKELPTIIAFEDISEIGVNMT